MAKKIIIANWKMNPQTAVEAAGLARAAASAAKKYANTNVVVCPPFPFLSLARGKRRSANMAWGAQNVFWEGSGHFTGEVSPAMLKNLGVDYAIIGHSERRKYLGETDEMINRKLRTALAAGLKVVLCVGESLPVRRKGTAAAEKFVRNQLARDLGGVGRLAAGRLFIAYEPIWAIGTGKPDTPPDAVAMARCIKYFCRTRFRLAGIPVLYGGSVDSKDAEDFLQYKEIDGALVGGASLKPDEFKKLIAIASRCQMSK